jgi:hypothetical protein
VLKFLIPIFWSSFEKKRLYGNNLTGILSCCSLPQGPPTRSLRFALCSNAPLQPCRPCPHHKSTFHPRTRHCFGGSMIASRFISRGSSRIFSASFSNVPLKGSYTAITEQLWRQREQAKLRDTSASASDKGSSMSPKPQKETLVVYDFPGDPRLKDEYSNPWGDVR